MDELVFEVKNATKYYGEVRALEKANFSLKKGEIHAVLGVNGAGKSTLIKCISGFTRLDSGELFANGKKEQFNSPQDAMKHGIATVYQDPQLIPMFTGYENVYLGGENAKRTTVATISRKKMKQNAKELMEKFSFFIDIEKPAYLMNNIEKEIVEILRALSTEMSILILDEPTSILTEKEKEMLFEIMRLLKKNGISMIYITHRIEEINMICDRVTIFRDGKDVATIEVGCDGIDAGSIVEIMLGKKLDMMYPSKGEATDEVVFEIKDVSISNIMKDISFKVAKGQILGIFGLHGSGIDELSKALYGAIGITQGELYAHGEKIDLKSTADALGHKIFLLPGDRKTEGYVAGHSIAFNISLSKLRKIRTKLSFVSRKKESSTAVKIVDELNIITPNIYQEVEKLSGGNQQKVVIGKGLFSEADIYIFSEPTVGVDVGAKASIYSVLRELSKEAGVIVISSDCEEVYGLADQILVLYKGGISLEKEVHETDAHTMLVHAVSDNVSSKDMEE